MRSAAESAAVEDMEALLDRFNAAWNAHDLDGALALVSDDVVFESTSPAPDGERFTGRAAVRRAWAPIFADCNARFTVEDRVISDHHLTQLWRYDWTNGHVRGIDLISVRDGLITAKLAYVKG